MPGCYDLMLKKGEAAHYPFIARLAKGYEPPDGWERVTELGGRSVYQKSGILLTEYWGLFIYPWNRKTGRFVERRCKEAAREPPTICPELRLVPRRPKSGKDGENW